MMRFVKVRRAREQLLALFCAAVAVATAAAAAPRYGLAAAFRSPTEILRQSKCVYHNIQYGAGDFVKTGEPCLNCTCSNGAIVCHLRVCSPIPNPPPAGCFILHKKDMCCAELVCNDDNNILFDGLEARSRPGASEDTELDLENLTKLSRNKGCVINGTTYAEGSALSSSTDCNYCFCLKGREQCVRPNCILQLAGCTPIFNKHACCPVKYNCHGSDNVTIISTELSLGHATRITTPGSNQELLSSVNQNEASSLDTESSNFVTEKIKSTDVVTEINTMGDQRQTNIAEGKYTQYTAISTDKAADEPAESSSQMSPAADDAPVRSTDEPAVETITEISTSISLIKTELVLKEVAAAVAATDAGNQPAFVEERRNTFSDADVVAGDSTQAYDRSSKANFTSKAADATATMKTIPLEIEALLNITKKKQEGDYELDYDEPTLPPSLPNLKIIPFVAADALDKPKEAVIEHREDTSLVIEVTDSILEPPVLLAGQFSPPVKTEGGFVPRDPTLDGPYFESKYNNIYQTTDNTDVSPSEQIVLPSITEPSKVVDNAMCAIGYFKYRHGELISEPKACNMCLCLYGEVVCQKPQCPSIKPGCKRINYNEDVSNCCGEVVCDDDAPTSPASSTESEKVDIITIPSEEPMVVNVTQDYSIKESTSDLTTRSETPPTPPPLNPTYMTFKVKGSKNHSTEHPIRSSSAPTTERPSATSTAPSSQPSHTTTALKSDRPSTEKDPDYDNGFSLENMLSFLFDEPPVLKSKNASTQTPATTTATTATSAATTSTTSAPSTTTVELLTSASTTAAVTSNSTTAASTSANPKTETDSAIYMIKSDDSQYAKPTINYTDDQTNTIKQQVNSYYVPPLGNFEEVILNPTKKPFGGSKKPAKVHPYFSTTYRPRHTTAKVIPLSRPAEKNATPQAIAGDPGAASGLLKLSGCNIFGKMYRIGKIIAELSGPCLQCMCAEVGVHCLPLKC